MWWLHSWSQSWRNLLFTTLRQSGRITCLNCVCRMYLLTRFCQLWIMLKTILSSGKMKYNLNIGLVFKSPSLCIYLLEFVNIGMGTLTLGLWQSTTFILAIIKCMTTCFCNSVLGYTSNTSKTKATHSL